MRIRELYVYSKIGEDRKLSVHSIQIGSVASYRLERFVYSVAIYFNDG